MFESEKGQKPARSRLHWCSVLQSKRMSGLRGETLCFNKMIESLSDITQTQGEMLLDSGVGEDSWKSLGLQEDPTSPSSRKPVLNIHWKDWCWSWSSNTLATWSEELQELKLQYFGHLKNWLTRKDPDAGEDWSGEEKGMTEDERVGWHHWLDAH